MSNLKLPEYMAEIINDIIAGENQAILSVGIKMLLVSVFGAFCIIGAGYLAARVSTHFSMKMREKIFTKTENFSLEEFNRFSISSLITRSTNDIQQIQGAIFMMMRMMLVAPITAVGAIIMAVRTAPSLTWIMGTGIITLIVVMISLFRIGMPKFKKMQKTIDDLNSITRENLTGLRVVRAFNAEKYEEEKFDKINKELSSLNLFLNRLMVLMQPSMTLIYNFTAIGAIWLGAKMIETGQLPIGNMIAFIQYSMHVLFSFMMISMIFIILPRASISAERVAEIIESEIIVKEKNETVQKKETKGLLKFQNVSFHYPGAEYPVLQNISFTAKPGETVAIIGSTGSGKTTLINLIPRLYDVSSGKISIDNIDIRDFSFSDLRQKISFAPQKSILFSGTIEENIKYGAPNADSAQILQATATSQSQSFIETNTEGLSTVVSQNGTNFSGGQKQRLTIARAILKPAEIYIFDDSFSALDFKTDKKVRDKLKIDLTEKTILIIAQRISTITSADKIIVLDNGKIVGQGKHDELLKNCDIYKEIAISQL